jgi:hypothetical protein
MGSRAGVLTMTFDDSLAVRDARTEFFRVAGLPADGGYSARFIHFRLGRLSFPLPNSAARTEAVPLHDLHHLATGYDTSWRGEAEIAAWELASGCASYRAAWIFNLLAFPLGLLIAPLRTWRAFQRGRASGNLYCSPWDETWLDASLGSLRARLFRDVDTPSSRAGDMLLFLACALPGLLGLAALILGAVILGFR